VPLLSQPEAQHIETQIDRAGAVSGQTLKRWGFWRRGPGFVQPEGRVYYPREELDRWLAETGVAPPDESTKMEGV